MILLFGLSWTSIVAFATIMVIAAIFSDDGVNVLHGITMLIFLIPFWIIGISSVITGIKNIKRIKEAFIDYTTNPPLYGKIYNKIFIRKNSHREEIYRLQIAIFDPDTCLIENIEILTSYSGKYSVGTYVKIRKLGQGYSIEDRVLDDQVPIDAKIELDNIELKDENGYSVNSKDTIIVNGVEYVRKK